MKEIKPTKEGKVNIALGDKETCLEMQAKINGTTKTALARVLILEGLRRLETGAMRYLPATVEPTDERGVA